MEKSSKIMIFRLLTKYLRNFFYPNLLFFNRLQKFLTEYCYNNDELIYSTQIKTAKDRILTSNSEGEFVRIEYINNDSLHIIEQCNNKNDTITINEFSFTSSIDFFKNKKSKIPTGFHQQKNGYFIYCETNDSSFILYNGRKSNLFPKLVNYSYLENIENELIYAGLDEGYFIIQRISDYKFRIIMNNHIFIIDNTKRIFEECINFSRNELILYTLTDDGVVKLKLMN